MEWSSLKQEEALGWRRMALDRVIKESALEAKERRRYQKRRRLVEMLKTQGRRIVSLNFWSRLRESLLLRVGQYASGTGDHISATVPTSGHPLVSEYVKYKPLPWPDSDRGEWRLFEHEILANSEAASGDFEEAFEEPPGVSANGAHEEIGFEGVVTGSQNDIESFRSETISDFEDEMVSDLHDHQESRETEKRAPATRPAKVPRNGSGFRTETESVADSLAPTRASEDV